jgi:hypothetical protein
MNVKTYSGNLTEGNNLRNLDVDGRKVILEVILFLVLDSFHVAQNRVQKRAAVKK